MKFIGVNGIWSNGDRSTDKLGIELEKRGHSFLDLNQERRTAWGARFYVRHDAEELVKAASDGDIVIAHSYGCLKAAIAAKTINFKAMYLFRPAMSKWHSFRKVSQDTDIYCIFSRDDWTILLGSLLIHHPFGLAGFSGFYSPRVRNVASYGHHSNDFSRALIPLWATYIEDSLVLMTLKKEILHENAAG